MPKTVQERQAELLSDVDQWEKRIEEFLDTHWDGECIVIREFGDLGTQLPDNHIQKEIRERYILVGFDVKFIDKNTGESTPNPFVSIIKLQGKSTISEES